MDIPGLGLTQAIEEIFVNWLFGSYEQLEAWAAAKTETLTALPWLNSVYFNLLYGFPFIMALFVQILAVSFVGLLIYAVFKLFENIKIANAEKSPVGELDEAPRTRRRRARRRRFK